MAKIMTARQAIDAYIKDGATIGYSGFVGAAHAEEISSEIGKCFLETGHPCGLTLMYAAGQGDGKELGLNHFGE